MYSNKINKIIKINNKEEKIKDAINETKNISKLTNLAFNHEILINYFNNNELSK